MTLLTCCTDVASPHHLQLVALLLLLSTATPTTRKKDDLQVTQFLQYPLQQVEVCKAAIQTKDTATKRHQNQTVGGSPEHLVALQFWKDTMVALVA